jgi:hypothetical protein
MDDELQGFQDRLLRSLQIIVAALALGSLVFLVVALVLAQQDVMPAAWNRSIRFLPILVACGVAVIRWGVMMLVAASGRRRILAGKFQVTRQPADPRMVAFLERGGDRARLFMVHFLRTIVGAAMLEGTAFFVLLMYLAIDRWPWNLAVAGVLIGLIVLHFPTRGSVDAWVDHQQRRIDDERQMSR